MPRREGGIVVRPGCEKPYVARIGRSGEIILPVGGTCACGGESFDRVEATEVGADASVRAGDGWGGGRKTAAGDGSSRRDPGQESPSESRSTSRRR